jgi:hypothetical protein
MGLAGGEAEGSGVPLPYITPARHPDTCIRLEQAHPPGKQAPSLSQPPTMETLHTTNRTVLHHTQPMQRGGTETPLQVDQETPPRPIRPTSNLLQGGRPRPNPNETHVDRDSCSILERSRSRLPLLGHRITCFTEMPRFKLWWTQQPSRGTC